MKGNARTVLLVAAACCGAGLAYGLAQSIFGGPDMAAVRRDAAESGRTACFRTARSQTPTSVADAKVTEYCGCATDRGLAALSDEELTAIGRSNGAMTPAVQTKLASAADACQSRLLP